MQPQLQGFPINLYGLIEFPVKKGAGLPPVVGCEFEIGLGNAMKTNQGLICMAEPQHCSLRTFLASGEFQRVRKAG